jgi:hypothetical protein
LVAHTERTIRAGFTLPFQIFRLSGGAVPNSSVSQAGRALSDPRLPHLSMAAPPNRARAFLLALHDLGLDRRCPKGKSLQACGSARASHPTRGDGQRTPARPEGASRRRRRPRWRYPYSLAASAAWRASRFSPLMKPERCARGLVPQKSPAEAGPRAFAEGGSSDFRSGAISEREDSFHKRKASISEVQFTFIYRLVP